MCIARVGRVIALSKDMARVQFFDNTTLDGVNVSMVKAKQGTYLEVYANVALSVLSTKEAASRKKDWLMIRKAAGLTA
jgi:hydrogenase maturation factor